MTTGFVEVSKIVGLFDDEQEEFIYLCDQTPGAWFDLLTGSDRPDIGRYRDLYRFVERTGGDDLDHRDGIDRLHIRMAFLTVLAWGIDAAEKAALAVTVSSGQAWPPSLPAAGAQAGMVTSQSPQAKKG